MSPKPGLVTPVSLQGTDSMSHPDSDTDPPAPPRAGRMATATIVAGILPARLQINPMAVMSRQG